LVIKCTTNLYLHLNPQISNAIYQRRKKKKRCQAETMLNGAMDVDNEGKIKEKAKVDELISFFSFLVDNLFFFIRTELKLEMFNSDDNLVNLETKVE
jgi:hypothetical protein